MSGQEQKQFNEKEVQNASTKKRKSPLLSKRGK
mgnify:CR=1 FL=1